MSDESERIRQIIQELQIEHRDLDDIITRLTSEPYPNQLQLRRLKKRKLMLKDRIHQLKSMLIPDLDA